MGVETDAAPARRLVLALGSGGTRGFAHLGVIKALLAAGLRIDGICGASAGALFGALYAMDGRLESALEAMTATPNEIAALYRDRLRLAGSNPLGVRLAARFGETTIESLAVPLSILTLDLETGEEVILREGRLLPAVAASIAIPILARPVELGGRRLIDGGYGDSGAARAARSMDGVVVEVDLGVRRRLPRALGGLARGALSRLRAGRARFARVRRAALGMGTLLTGQTEQLASHADLIIAPALSDLVVHSPFAAAEAFRRGEQATTVTLPRLRELLR